MHSSYLRVNSALRGEANVETKLLPLPLSCCPGSGERGRPAATLAEQREPAQVTRLKESGARVPCTYMVLPGLCPL